MAQQLHLQAQPEIRHKSMRGAKYYSSARLTAAHDRWLAAVDSANVAAERGLQDLSAR